MDTKSYCPHFERTHTNGYTNSNWFGYNQTTIPNRIYEKTYRAKIE